MSKKWHIDWALKFLMKKCHVLTLRTHTINKMLTLRILIINKFHHNKYYPSQPHDYPNYNLQITSFSAGQGSTSFSSSAQYPSSSNKYLPSFQYNTDTRLKCPGISGRIRSWQEKEESSPNLWCTLVTLLRTKFRSRLCSNQCTM
jgi:hypothetical protein